jgi:hypothetical protein
MAYGKGGEGAGGTSRLFFLAGHTSLGGTRAEGWKLQVVSSGTVAVPAEAVARQTGAP